ncbi:alkaline phosphatase [Exophiala aquamarina CBS 119918]|uniref:Alkaline phosphatase n=1 Tax=Exophiala aquamarina CBS 119918 TaxID=1182545 RepID=A0A072P9A9_9EURO|nr:alkaline phosphatase [Exophiala aquamarina CBS 119918]KEF56307.1 alkaline phosphatase [Exophiala aquamarina CBS 119918]
MLQLLVLSCLIVSTLASYGANLNYRSPSHNHPGLGVSVRKVVKRHNPRSAFADGALNFTHGVASGDPYPNSVILWTRCAPNFDNIDDNSTVSGTVQLYNPVPIFQSNDTDQHKPVSNAPVCLNWKIASDQGLTAVVDSGRVHTSSDVDYTVKVEATKLKPFTQYWYQFSVCNSNVSSLVGRTKTTPAPTDDTSAVNLAVYSCSNYPFGYFNAYGNTVRKNSVDYVLHLGDYIYEYGNGEYGWGNSIGRIPLPDRQIYTLYDYRKRHATYRTDHDLLLSHQNMPWIPVWDDHEVADNTWRDGSAELNNTEASFVADGGVSVDQRKMNAVRAYWEWQPIRQVDISDDLRIWRSFAIGNLLDLVMLDTRQYDRSITDLYWNTHYVHEISNDAGRSMMGSRQENWFYQSLIDSKNRGATWRVIGSQTVFSRINASFAYGNVDPFNYDQWDGYLANRNRTYKTLYDNNITNNIMISGDSHANWVSDLVWLDEHPYNASTGEGSVGVEFAGSAVSSPSPAGQNISIAASVNASAALVLSNPELQWQEFYYRGYFELHISHDKVDAKYFGLPTLINRNPNEISLANFTVYAGENRLHRFNGTTASGPVENGFLKFGQRLQTNMTNSTATGLYFISHEDVEDL